MANLRRATLADTIRLMEIRFAVQENRLADPTSVTAADCAAFIARDLIWVAEEPGRIVGFSASNDLDGTILALFIDPTDQCRGLGAGLLALACADLADNGFSIARLTTDPGTRADRFYCRHGWKATGIGEDGEVQSEKVM